MRVILASLSFLAAFMIIGAAHSADSLEPLLSDVRAKYALPAIAAAVVKNGDIVAVGAVGERVVGSGIAVTRDDRFHIGSDTKAMTATLAAIMVEDGKLRWNSTIGEVLGGDLPGLKPEFAAITLEQLLSHTSGIAPDNQEIGKLYFSNEAYDHPLSEWRLHMIQAWGSQHGPSFPASGKFQYSNLGYITAGAMIEKASGQPWERLMFERIYRPLGMVSAGIGAQASFGRYDAPVGHRVDAKGKTIAYPWGEPADLPASLGPAGLAHMSIVDFAIWGGWNAAEGKRGPRLISPETMKFLHTPVAEMEIKDPKPGTPKSGAYALGWGLSKFDWTDKPILTHNGSNGLNFASIEVDVDNDLAIVVTSNIGGADVDRASLELMKTLYEKYVR